MAEATKHTAMQIKPEHVGDVAWRIRFKGADGRYMTFFAMVDCNGTITHIPNFLNVWRYSNFETVRAEILEIDPNATFTDVTAFVDSLEQAGG